MTSTSRNSAALSSASCAVSCIALRSSVRTGWRAGRGTPQQARGRFAAAHPRARRAAPALPLVRGSPSRSLRYSERMRVKFCGITRLEDARGRGLGAWAIGLNHWPRARAAATRRPRCEIGARAAAQSRSSASSSTRRSTRSRPRSRTSSSRWSSCTATRARRFCAEVARRTGAQGDQGLPRPQPRRRPGGARPSAPTTTSSTPTARGARAAPARASTGSSLAAAARADPGDPRRRPEPGQRRRGDRGRAARSRSTSPAASSPAPGIKDHDADGRVRRGQRERRARGRRSYAR